MSHPIKVGDQVVKGGNAYIVCEVDGNVIGLRRLSGSFYQYTHVDNVHVQLALDLTSSSPAADQGPAQGLAAPAGLAVGGTSCAFGARGLAGGQLSEPVGYWYGHRQGLVVGVLGGMCHGYSERRA